MYIHHVRFSSIMFSQYICLQLCNNNSFGAVIWFIAAGIATSCGVGGGGIYVPLGIILLRFASKPSSGLSQASIFGASLGGLLLNIRNKHPDEKIRDTVGKRDSESKIIPYTQGMTRAEIEVDEELYLSSTPENGDGHKRKFYTRPLIDYDMALFLAPLEMAGAVIGVIIQKLMPNWLFLSLAAIILGCTSFKTFQKFFSVYKKEKDDQIGEQRIEELVGLQNGKSKSAGDDTDTDTNTNNCEENSHSVDSKTKDYGSLQDVTRESTVHLDNADKFAQRRILLKEDSRQFPLEKILGLVILWMGLALITFLKGGKGVDSPIGITCRSRWYMILIIFEFLWLLGFALVFGLKLVRRDAKKVASLYPFLKSDVIWDLSKLRFYATFTLIAGIVAGLIGIGGGMVLGPLMMVMGIHPLVSSATTATMIVLTSSSVAIMFVTSGLVPWEYAVFFFCICFCGACVGKIYIDAHVKKTGMTSVLIGILASIIAFATVGCLAIVIINLSSTGWCFDGFKKFCHVKDDERLICSISKN